MLVLGTIMGVVAVVLSLAAALLVAGIVINLFTRVPYVPAPMAAVQHALALLRLQPGERVVDLGCGDGRLVLAAAATGAQATGYELAITPLLRAYWRRLTSRTAAQLRWQNFLSADLGQVDAVFAYLVESVMASVGQKLSSELKPGARIVCYGTPLPGWTPVQVHDPVPGAKSRFYVYVK